VNQRVVLVEQIITSCTRVGFIFVICGIFAGLVFSEWIPILFFGFIYLLPVIVLRLVENRWETKSFRSSFVNFTQLNKEEI